MDVDEKCVWIGIGMDIKDKELYEECKKINKKLVKEYGSSIIFSKNNMPHLNLYDLSVPKKNLPEIVKRLKKIALNRESFDVDITGINYFPFGLFFIELKINNFLYELHKLIVNEITQLKGNGICEDYLEPVRKYNPNQKEMLKNHGNPFVLSEFKPHITLGLIKENNLDYVKKELTPLFTKRKFTVDNIHIVVEDENRKKVIGKFGLMGY
ncbi:MAG: 2'-5' RNA ligase family protein [Nanoarchaeota archaeon]